MKTLRDFGSLILGGLIKDDRGRFSQSKFWSNIAYAVASWVMVKMTAAGTLEVEYFIWYLVIAGGHSAISKYIVARSSGSYQFPTERPPGSQKTPEENV